MKILGFGFFVILTIPQFFMSSCTKTVAPSNPTGVITETIAYEGVQRTYHIYMPTNFNKNTPTPMVLALHGGGGTGANFEEVVSSGTLSAAAEARGVVLVMPEGIKKRWNSGRPEIFNGEQMYDDVGFISNIIDNMVENYGIDSKRVYATGISNGGFMSLRLAFDLSNRIAAVAPVTAQISKVHEDKRPQVPISVMIINGTGDPLVPYDGGHIRLFKLGASRGEVLSTQESVEKFGNFNQCNLTAEQELLPNTVANDDTEVEIITYQGCSEAAEVILVKIIGGGHTWPSGAQYLPPRRVGVVSKEVNASEMILDFFLRHQRN